ncbi:DNA internalization-related competence protein ComEC/Rec2 [Halanaerocella petrolearia]
MSENQKMIDLIRLGISLLSLITIYSWQQRYDKTKILVWILIFSLGFLYLQYLNLDWKEDWLREYLGVRKEFKAKVVGIEERKERIRYLVTDIKFSDSDQVSDRQMLLNHWEIKDNFDYGDIIKVTANIEIPSRQRNPGGFSYRNYLKEQGVYAIGQIETIKKVGKEVNWLFNSLFNLRQKIIQRIKTYFSSPQDNLLQSLLLGDKAQLSTQVKDKFKKLGVSHLLVISGFHIGLISYLIYSCGQYLKLPQGLLLVLTIFFLAGYLVLTGCQLPSLRAVLLIISVLIGRYLERRIDLYNLLAGVGVIILIINPRSLFTISFQLSFLAVVTISYLAPCLEEYLDWLPTRIQDIVAATLAAQLGLLPVLAYYFNQISIGSLIANLFLIPLISIILWLGIVFISIGFINQLLAKLIASGINLLLLFTLQVIEYLADYIAISISLATPNLGWIIVYYLVIYYFGQLIRSRLVSYYKKYRNQGLIICLGLILLLLIQLGFNNYPQLKVIFFDVGQADGAYIRTPSGQKILVDTGKSGQKIISFLESQGIEEVDLILISHFHQDHIGGVLPIIKKFKVNKVCIPPTVKDNKLKQNLKQLINKKKIKLFKLAAGDKIDINPIQFKVVGPTLPLLKDDAANNNSLVVQLVYKEFKLLLTGDIERQAEKRIVASGYNIDSSLLKLAHHGSQTSSTNNFLNYVRPQVAVVSVGENKYGHPNIVVLNRLKNKNIKVLRTDKQGAITLFTDGERYKYNTFLDKN